MSKRKVHNPQRRLERLGKAVLKGCAIIFVAGNNGLCQMVEIKTKKTFKPGVSLAKTITAGRYIWSIYLAVFCRDQTGKEYMQSVVITTKEPCLQCEVQDVLKNHHFKLLDGCNSAHILNVGWLASPIGHDWTEKEAGEIFANMNAWDFVAEWEKVT